ALGVLMASFAIVGCQRMERGVEAARENSTDSSDALTTADRDFIRKAVQSNMHEIDMAQLAEQKSTDSDVKDYASMLVKDHKSALKDLNSIMDKNNAPQTREESKEHAAVDRLKKLDPSQFDRTFRDSMVAGHKKALEAYRSEGGSVQNADLKEHVT